jgi:hypothetical protein
MGGFAEWVESTHGIACLTISHLAQLREAPPNRVVLMHWPAYFALQREGIAVPTVFGFLGRSPALENPPPLVPGLGFPWFAVSETIATNVASISTWGANPNRLVRNWTGWSKGSVRPALPLRRLAIVSNRMTDELEQQLIEAGRRAGIEVTRFGLPRNPQILHEALLEEFDCIVSLGRSILDAMRLGRPAMIFDVHGADGWVTPETVERYAGESFSGRQRAHRPTDAELDTWLANPPTTEQLRSLQIWVEENATLESALNQLDDLFAAATAPAVTWGQFGEVPVEMMEELAVMRQGLAIREQQLENLTIDRDNVVARIRSIENAITRVRPRFLSRILIGLAQRRLAR